MPCRQAGSHATSRLPLIAAAAMRCMHSYKNNSNSDDILLFATCGQDKIAAILTAHATRGAASRHRAPKIAVATGGRRCWREAVDSTWSLHLLCNGG